MSVRTSRRRDDGTCTAVEVEEFLRQQPDFFHRHLDLLESLKIPHPCGEAVSLVARQLDLLRERIRRQQIQLNDILQVARDNDTLYHRMHQLTLALLDAATVEDALAGLKWGLHQYFQADFVAVRIVEPQIESPIADLCVASSSEGFALFAPVWDAGRPLCGKPDAAQARFLFGTVAAEVRSNALVPLQHAGLRGMLAIGSRDPGRFQPGMGFLFLSQMGEILSARLATLLNRQI